VAALWQPTLALAQERTGYVLGDRQGLEMMVHIIGEVQKPGEYRVRDQTDLLELVSKAGGPTQFSRLGAVVIRRTAPRSTASMAESMAPRTEILRVDLDRIMRDRNANPPPLLLPGDVVLVPKNTWHRWKDFASVARDVSVVASAYFLYLRAIKN
jgi:SLBB domain-containing protein